VSEGDSRRERVEVLGCRLDPLTLDTTVSRILELIQNAGPARQVSVNALKVNLCANDPELAELIERFDLVSADGVSIVWASRLLGVPLPGRVNGTDLMERLIDAAEVAELSIYLLGSRPEILEAANGELRATHPRLRIAGMHHGYFSDHEEERIVGGIRDARADILFVGMPSPGKERWIDRYIDELGVRFVMGVGGSIDVIAGVIPRAPVWMQRAGLEWLFRLVREPRRMWRRYLLGGLAFAWRLGMEVISTRRRRPRPGGEEVR
jgi:N-acetylglucosaminyldiphosphoundecaprenol N-acetyl-beta-D-mannosaminyltransferase